MKDQNTVYCHICDEAGDEELRCSECNELVCEDCIKAYAHPCQFDNKPATCTKLKEVNE